VARRLQDQDNKSIKKSQLHIHAPGTIKSHDPNVQRQKTVPRLRPTDGVTMRKQHHTVISSQNLCP